MSANNSRANIKFNFSSARTERSRSRWRMASCKALSRSGSRFFCVPLAFRAQWNGEISPDNNSLSFSTRARVFSRALAPPPPSVVCMRVSMHASDDSEKFSSLSTPHSPTAVSAPLGAFRAYDPNNRKAASELETKRNKKRGRRGARNGKGKRWRSKTSVQPRTQ